MLVFLAHPRIALDLERVISDYTRELKIPEGTTNVTTIFTSKSITFLGFKVSIAFHLVIS